MVSNDKAPNLSLCFVSLPQLHQKQLLRNTSRPRDGVHEVAQRAWPPREPCSHRQPSASGPLPERCRRRSNVLRRALQLEASNETPAEDLDQSRNALPKRFPRGRYEQMRKYRVVRQGVTLPGGRKRWRKVAIPVEPRLRITGGTARGRRLESPPVYIRPAMAQVREAAFSMLRELQILPSRRPLRFLDLFCGAGTMGFEALSRGASEIVFVDRSPECCACVRRNLERLGVKADAAVVRETTVEAYLAAAPDGVLQVMALTPPYEEINYNELLKTVAQSAAVGERTVVMLEYPTELGSLPPVIENRLVGMRNRRYGRTVLGMYACQPDADWDIRTEEFSDMFIRQRRNYMPN